MSDLTTLTKPELQEIAERIRSRYRRAIEDIVATGNDLIVWVAGPPGVPMPQPPEYGLKLAAPSSAEVLAMAGGG